MLYSTHDKIQQDIFLLKFCEGTLPKKGTTNLHSVSIKYYVPKHNGERIKVCKKAFQAITGISPYRIERIVRNFVKNSETPKEKRGGDRVKDKNDQKKRLIKEFIESLNCAESHYRRNYTTRLYLPCNLNFTKLYRLFYERNPDPLIRLCYFRNYINRNYNLAFGTPLTDACSTCLQSKEELKKVETENDKLNIMARQRVHILKAKAFYNLLKEEDESLKFFPLTAKKIWRFRNYLTSRHIFLNK